MGSVHPRCRTLPCGPEAPGRAREAVGELELPEPVDEDVKLVVSELVTNAVRHGGLTAGDPITLCLAVAGGRIRGEVGDPGLAGVPEPAPPRGPAEGGLGLVLVEAVAASWGVERREGVTRVWFELDTGDAAVPDRTRSERARG